MVRISKIFRSIKRSNPNPDPSKSSPSSSRSRSRSSFSWLVYLILSTNTPIKTYVGVTTNFSRRLKQHNGELKGGAKASRTGRPWVCACIIQGFKDKSEGTPHTTELNSSLVSISDVSVTGKLVGSCGCIQLHGEVIHQVYSQLASLNQNGKVSQENCPAKGMIQ
ncbi:uncharacterized protein LOC117927941 isoform X1 [Vitis riparia]|uniref:uncharacterized protein LOC117927941 isoform X1 n=1 Tax=Vitis riparia TaxID=96939 RepID=UPI00155A47BE|nr:uncharacterized protein LOC117927941 isoform X1 [Vitis riparia]